MVKNVNLFGILVIQELGIDVVVRVGVLSRRDCLALLSIQLDTFTAFENVFS